MCTTAYAVTLITVLLISHNHGQLINRLPDGYLCHLSKINDCLEKVPVLPVEWNITDAMSYCKEQTRPRDSLTLGPCSFDDPSCIPERCPVPLLHYQNVFDQDDYPLESIIVKRIMDRRYPYPVFLVKWLPMEGANFYVVQQSSDQIMTPYYYETKQPFATIPSWGSCTRNYIRVASVINSRLHFFSAPAMIFDEPRFPRETPAQFDFMDATLTNSTVATDFLPANDERVIYVRVGYRLRLTTTTYDIAHIGEATMFSPNCRLDFISLYPRPIKLPGSKEFLFTFPESYAARNCTVAVKIHNVVTRCNQTISILTTEQQQTSTATTKARQRLGIVPPTFLNDRLQAMKQLKFRLDCHTVRKYDCQRTAELLKPSCGVTGVDALADPEPGVYWLIWGALLRPKNLPIRSWVILAHHTPSNDTRRFTMLTSDNLPADYGSEFRNDRRLKVEFGISRAMYRVQICAVYDNKYDETSVNVSAVPERMIQLFDQISDSVARPNSPRLFSIEPSDELINDVAVTRMEIVRRALSDRMIVALAVGVALAVSIAVCVPFVLCNAIRKRRQCVDAKLGPDKNNDCTDKVIKIAPILKDAKY